MSPSRIEILKQLDLNALVLQSLSALVPLGSNNEGRPLNPAESKSLADSSNEIIKLEQELMNNN